jgi:7-cyano-7-deazaguanine synthase
VKPNLIILSSGGSDSTLLLHMALEQGLHPHCVLIDYEQNQKIELNFARRYLNEKSIPYQTVQLHQLSITSGLTTGEKSLYDDVNEMYVPSRNLMFVSIAASIAENMKISTIWYGANFSDWANRFPDCTATWIETVNDLLYINGSMKIELEAPLILMTTEKVMKELEDRKIDMGKIFSGYLEDNKSTVLDLNFIGNKKLPNADAKSLGIGIDGEQEEIEPGLWSKFKT